MSVGKDFNDPRRQEGGTAGHSAALLVHEAVLRMCRAPAGRVAVVLHLSRLVPPAPRPYHIRIVRALLDDTAARNEGQVFTLGNGDMVLLCAIAPTPSPAPVGGNLRSLAIDPATLPSILGRLLRADMKQAEGHVSVWRLDECMSELQAYTAARVGEAEGPKRVASDYSGGGTATKGKSIMDEDDAGQTGLVAAMGHVVEQPGVIDLMHRQTAIVLGAESGHRDASGGLRPIFQEIHFSMAALEARLMRSGGLGSASLRPGQAMADPFLFRHLAGRLDQRMLDVLSREVGQGGPLDLLRGGHSEARAPVLHLNLTIPTILSPAFARLARICANAGSRIGVEIYIAEALIDPEQFGAARHVLAGHGLPLVLDGVSHTALLIARPGALRPNLLKLEWSTRLSELADPDHAALDAAIAEIDPARIVLHKADSEAALHWGVIRGIRRFQGRHVDSMLGASRIVACMRAEACTLRQCVERASAIGPAGRVGCRNRLLLDGVIDEAAKARVCA